MTKSVVSLRPHAIGMIVLSIIQYVFGVYTSLFVLFPNTKSPHSLWEFASGQLPIVVHIILGFLLLIGSLVLVIRALVIKDRSWIIAGSAALLSIVGAIIGGVIFIPTQQNSYSFLMAICFILALCAYFWGMYMTKD